MNADRDVGCNRKMEKALSELFEKEGMSNEGSDGKHQA